MSTRPDDELVQHARALRGIARALVDVGDVDDVVQEVAEQALQRPPTQVASMFGWLSGVVRNRARKHHRRERRRQLREQFVFERTHSSASTPPSPPTVAVHRETIALLDAALLALPQPYQDTVLLRYYEGLTPPQIAKRTATPLATVKSRLARGLALLRERLDAGDGDGGPWRAAFAAAFGMPQGTGVASIATLGILLMASKLVLAAIAVVVLGLGLWPFGGELVPAPTAQQSVRLDQTMGSHLVADATTIAPERDLAANQVAPAMPATQPVDGVTFAGRCVDEHGAPLADVLVDARTRERVGGHEHATVERTTGSDGRFVVTLPIVDKCYQDLMLTADGRCDVQGSKHDATAGERHELGDLVVPLARRVCGVVVDEQGTPQSGIRLRLYTANRVGTSIRMRPWMRPLDTGARVLTDEAGQFEVGTNLLPVRYALSIGNRVLIDSSAKILDLTSAPLARQLHLVVGPAPPICRGIVVRSDGSPIAGALVELDADRANTDADGRFVLHPKPVNEALPRRVSCFAIGFQRHQGVMWPYGDTTELRIVLRPNVAIVVHAVDGRTGLPLKRYSARVVAPSGWRGGWEPATTHQGGTCRIPKLAGKHFVIVRPEQEELQESCFVPVTLFDDVDVEVTIT